MPRPAEMAATAGTAVSGYAGRLVQAGIPVPARGKFVLVNIPAYELIAFEDGEVALRSRVVVGRPATPTPELETPMEAVTFNPSWTPTPAMVRFEGARFAPPGPNNPLGQVLFQLDNDALIFLHDTNDRSYFDRSGRALSHGCIRVQQARALAAWVLDTPQNEIVEMIRGRSTRSVPLPAPVPVSLVYRTSLPAEDGGTATYPDIYGHGAEAAGR